MSCVHYTKWHSVLKRWAPSPRASPDHGPQLPQPDRGGSPWLPPPARPLPPLPSVTVRGRLLLPRRSCLNRATRGKSPHSHLVGPVLPTAPRTGPHFTASHVRQAGSPVSAGSRPRGSGSPISTRARPPGDADTLALRERLPVPRKGLSRYSPCFPAACGFPALLLGAVTLTGHHCCHHFPEGSARETSPSPLT